MCLFFATTTEIREIKLGTVSWRKQHKRKKIIYEYKKDAKMIEC